jgi:hypothetical protein
VWTTNRIEPGDGTDGYPAVFIFKRKVPPRNGEGIVKNKNGSLETNIVFVQVQPVLAFVPLEAHFQRASFLN